MISNHVYNLMMQLVQESKSCERIRKQYIADAQKCEECKKFWQELQEDKEEHIRDLEKLIAEHL